MALYLLERTNTKPGTEVDEIGSLLIRAQTSIGARMIAKEYNGNDWIDPKKTSIKKVTSTGESGIILVSY